MFNTILRQPKENIYLIFLGILLLINIKTIIGSECRIRGDRCAVSAKSRKRCFMQTLPTENLSERH